MKMRNTNKSGFRWKRSGILLAAVIVLLAGAVGGTITLPTLM